MSGSLLGIDYKRASSYPVGYVDYLRMYGMDFEEFLWGMGISEDMIGNLCGYLESKTVIPEAIHSPDDELLPDSMLQQAVCRK